MCTHAQISDGSQQGDCKPEHAVVENPAHISKTKTHWAAAGGLTEKQHCFGNWRHMCYCSLHGGMVLARVYGAKEKPLHKSHNQCPSTSSPLDISTCKEWKHRTKKEPPEYSRSGV